MRALSASRFKIHRESTRESDIAYDLSLDPREKTPIPLANWADLPAEDGAELSRLQAVLDVWATKCRIQREIADKQRVKQADVDPLRREKLRALGYID